MLVVDAANVVGSRPNGWWRDRAGAAATLVREIAATQNSGRLEPAVVIVLEGAARAGVEEGARDGLRIVHASGNGDDAIASLVADAIADAQTVTVVTADRELQERAKRVGADVVGPRWLLDLLD